MAQNSNIGWTHHTANFWRGCTKVSLGCKNCYAETWSYRNPRNLGKWGPNGTRVLAAPQLEREISKWNAVAKAAGERHRVFCASLADVFEGEDTCQKAEEYANVEVGRTRLFAAIAANTSLDFLLLTKRPQNILKMVPDEWREAFPHNVWVGTSVENQDEADTRIPELIRVPAPVLFLSCEPLLDEVDVTPYLCDFELGRGSGRYNINWLITGGESGPKARNCRTDDIRALVEQCQAAQVPVFVKQLGAQPRWSEVARDQQFLITLRDRKGEDMSEWPLDLRVQQFPTPKALFYPKANTQVEAVAGA